MNLKQDDKIYLGQKEARFYSRLSDIDAVVAITHTAYMATGEFGDYEEVEEFDKLTVVPFSDISLKPLYDTDILSMKNLEIEKAKTEARRIVNEAKQERAIELTRHKKELQDIQKKISNFKMSFDGMLEAKEIIENEYFLVGYGMDNKYYTIIEKSKVLKSDDWSLKISIAGNDNDITFYPISYDEDYMFMSKYGRKGLMFKTREKIVEFLNTNITKPQQYSLEKIEEFESLGISKDIFKKRKENLNLIDKKSEEAKKIREEIEFIRKNEL